MGGDSRGFFSPQDPTVCKDSYDTWLSPNDQSDLTEHLPWDKTVGIMWTAFP